MQNWADRMKRLNDGKMWKNDESLTGKKRFKKTKNTTMGAGF
jgi:hypothetical protein